MPNAPDLSVSRLRSPARVMRLGFVRLFDAAPLVVADELGLFDAVGIRVAVAPERSWAAVRDKLAFGALDGAQLLGPMPIALAAGLGGVEARVHIACGLSRNGNGITLSTALAAEPDLAAALKARAAAGRPATFAVVFSYSAQYYLLRRWLVKQGVDPEVDVRFTVIPPPRMAATLRQSEIDGFCAAAPWGAAATLMGAGRTVAGTAEVWPNHPEKLFGFGDEYVSRHREEVVAATAAVIAAARWLDDPANREAALDMLSQRELWDLDRATVASAFDPIHRMHFRSATLPRREEAAWWLREMRALGHVPPEVPDAAALAPFGDELWHEAAARLNEPEPALEPLP